MNKFLIDCESNLIEKKALSLAVAKVLKQKAKIYAEIVFVDEEEIRKLNLDNRNKDAVTDVLSFPNLDGIRGIILNKKDFPLDVENFCGKSIFLGSIAICEKRAEEQAEEYGHSKKRELNYLTVHGILHLFGYDHENEEDKKQMRALEEEILKQAGIEL